MGKKKRTKIVLYAAIAVLVMLIVGVTGVLHDPVCTEQNTTEFSAVMHSAQEGNVTFTGDVHRPFNQNETIMLTFSVVSQAVGEDVRQLLYQGQTVSFRVRNRSLPQEGEKELLLPIVSLRTDDRVILTLDAYNAWEWEERKTSACAGMAFCCMMCIVIILCIIRLRRQ